MDFFTEEVTQYRWEQILSGVMIALLTAFVIWIIKELSSRLGNMWFVFRKRLKERKYEKERKELIREFEKDVQYPDERLHRIKDALINDQELQFNDLMFLDRVYKNDQLKDQLLKDYYNSQEYTMRRLLSTVGNPEDNI